MIGKDRLIIGLTGSLGSGVSTSARYLVKTLGCKVYKITGQGWDSGKPEEVKDGGYKISKIIEEEAEKRGEQRNNEGEFDRELLQRIGNELRRENKGYLAIEVLKRIDQVETMVENANGCSIVVDGIKNSGEVEEFRKYANFFLFSIDARVDKRWERVREKYKGNQDSFFADDERDHNESIDYGQQVDKCVYLSDVLFNNDSDIKKQLYDRVDNYLSLIQEQNYMYPMPCESIMTQAYCESLKSSCIKRKVGAVIVSSDGTPVVATCNEVPYPEDSCEKKYGMCYKDKIKIDLIRNLKNCPGCGASIKQDITCPKCGTAIQINELTPSCKKCNLDLDIDSFFVCMSCKLKIVKKFIGKRMEVCRALHAEEKALLQLGKSGVSINPSSMTLYTTTFPCPQCANKIVGFGIGKIVYVEPYPTKESRDLLVSSLGERNIEKFEGVKARAYFKIYDRARAKSI
jgi:deoxycytidylate deaminase